MTVMVAVAVPMLPQASVAEKVTVRAVLHDMVMVVKSLETGRAPSQASRAVAVASQVLIWFRALGSLHWTCKSAGGVTTGGIRSMTVMVAVAVPMLPQASVAEKVTVRAVLHDMVMVVKSLETGRAPSQASRAVAVASQVLIWFRALGSLHWTCKSAGGVTTGGIRSMTVMVAVAVPMFLQASVALKVTVRAVWHDMVMVVISLDTGRA